MLNKDGKFSWPIYDSQLTEDGKNLIVIQINGKKRGLIETEKNINEEELIKLIMKDNKINKHLDDKTIKKKIFIKDKLINLII
jgi:leucyl-tRNA synthetase